MEETVEDDDPGEDSSTSKIDRWIMSDRKKGDEAKAGYFQVEQAAAREVEGS